MSERSLAISFMLKILTWFQSNEDRSSRTIQFQTFVFSCVKQIGAGL